MELADLIILVHVGADMAEKSLAEGHPDTAAVFLKGMANKVLEGIEDYMPPPPDKPASH